MSVGERVDTKADVRVWPKAGLWVFWTAELWADERAASRVGSMAATTAGQKVDYSDFEWVAWTVGWKVLPTVERRADAKADQWVGQWAASWV